MTGAAIEQLRSIAAAVGDAHPSVTRLLALRAEPTDASGRAPVQWIVVVGHRDRKAEAAVVRAIEAASAEPVEVFVVDERSYRIRERTPSMAMALRRAATLFSRPPTDHDLGRSP